MPNISTWTGVKVSMSAALGSANVVSAISKAASAVLSTTTTTGAAVGAYIYVTAQGMGQISGKVLRVSAVVANTSITVEDDSSGYDTFTSGTWQLVSATGTFANSLGGATSVSASGGEYDKIDTTLLADTVKSSIPGMASAIEYSLDAVWDVADAGLIAANAASKTQEKRAFMIAFRNNQRVVFAGTIGAEMIPGGSTGGMVTTKLSISAQGGQKAYAT